MKRHIPKSLGTGLELQSLASGSMFTKRQAHRKEGNQNLILVSALSNIPVPNLCSPSILAPHALTHFWKKQIMVSLHMQEGRTPSLPVFSNWVSVEKPPLSPWIPLLPGKHLTFFRRHPASTVHEACSSGQMCAFWSFSQPRCAYINEVSLVSTVLLPSLTFISPHQLC